MKILIGTHSLGSLGGTQTWTTTLYDTLTSMGHTVDLLTADGNYAIAEGRHRMSGIGHKYDLALVNHMTTMRYVMSHVKADTLVNVIHGVIPALETPVPGADVYIGVSEETASVARSLFPNSLVGVIRNPIDTVRFSPDHYGKGVLALGNPHSGFGNYLRNIKATKYGGQSQTRHPELAINQHAVVVAVGRSALESMACGRQVIIGGGSGVDGIVSYSDALIWRECNLSGRYMEQDWSVIPELIDRCPRELSESNRQYVLDHHNARDIAQQFLAIKEQV